MSTQIFLAVASGDPITSRRAQRTVALARAGSGVVAVVVQTVARIEHARRPRRARGRPLAARALDRRRALLVRAIAGVVHAVVGGRARSAEVEARARAA